MSNQSHGDVHGGMDPKLTMEALLGEMRRMNTKFDAVRKRLERVEKAHQALQPRIYNEVRREWVHRRDVHGGHGTHGLLMQRALTFQALEDEGAQRENIFRSRFRVKDKVGSVIIDGGSCVNIASTLMVEKLALPLLAHPQPYKLQCMNDGGVVTVTQQVLIHFNIGKYEDEVVCDVVPMEVAHMLLGRPWLCDRQVKHDVYTNKYSLLHKGKKLNLVPLSPSQANEDLQHHRRECEKREEEKKEAERQEAELKELLEWLEDEVKRVVMQESHEDSKPIAVSTKDHDESESMKPNEDKCYEVVAPVSLPRLASSFTMPPLDLRTNPFQEEGNDERKVEIERVIDEVLKMMLASVGGEFDFYEEPVTSKIARNRPERKPIWTTTWN